ncbi:MAG: hypothetical protein JWM98_3350, partial [Thermoleophilia bacterium]|nr:hypothetical protein [Thermoleophilia bacterium]
RRRRGGRGRGPDARVSDTAAATTARPAPHASRGRAREWLGAVGAAARVEAQVGVQYRANLLLWGAVRLLQSVVTIAVWRAVAAQGAGTTAGYTAGQFAGYFLCVLVAVELTYTWVAGRLPREIQTGELSPRLLRPVHPLLEWFGRMGAYNVLLTLGLLPSVVVLWAVFDAQVDWSPATALGAALVLPLSATTRFLADCLVGVCAFWLTRVDAIRSLYTYASLLLAGQFAPLALLPDSMRTVARVLPFYWTLGFPVELLTGRLTLHEALVGTCVLAAWCAALFALLTVAWRRGVRQYGAVGA